MAVLLMLPGTSPAEEASGIGNCPDFERQTITSGRSRILFGANRTARGTRVPGCAGRATMTAEIKRTSLAVDRRLSSRAGRRVRRRSVQLFGKAELALVYGDDEIPNTGPGAIGSRAAREAKDRRFSVGAREANEKGPGGARSSGPFSRRDALSGQLAFAAGLRPGLAGEVLPWAARIALRAARPLEPRPIFSARSRRCLA